MSGSSKSWSMLCALGLVSMSIAACGPESNNNTETPDSGTVTQMDMGEEDAGTESDAGAEGIPNTYQERYELRFDSLKFTEETIPNKESIAILLNGALKTNFDQSLESPIVILMDIKNIDPEAGTLEIRAGAGEKTVNEEEYEWDSLTPREYVDGTLDAATGEFEGTTPEFIFIATLGMGEGATRLPLKINNLLIKATLEQADEGNDAKIATGRLEGYMTEENADSSMIELSPGNPVVLSELFGKENMDFDSDEDGTNDSWLLYASFTARPTSID